MSTETVNDVVVSGAAMRAAVAGTLDLIAGNAERAERERRVPDENIEALRATGIFKSLQPAAYGGTPMGAEEYVPALVELGGACASTAWITGVLTQHAHMIALMSPELQDEVWGDDWVGDEHLVDVHIAHLRRKLGDDPDTARYISTVRCIGYRMGKG